VTNSIAIFWYLQQVNPSMWLQVVPSIDQVKSTAELPINPLFILQPSFIEAMETIITIMLF
jgi:hypothetical protein